MIVAASFDGSKADEEIFINAQLDLDDDWVQVVVFERWVLWCLVMVTLDLDQDL